MRVPHGGHEPTDSGRPPTRSQDDLLSRLVDSRGSAGSGEPTARTPDDLLAIAWYQKGLLVCILIRLVGVPFFLLLPHVDEMFFAFGFFGIVLVLVDVVFVFRLAIRLFGTGPGIAMSILTLAPCLGLVMFLIISGRASATLQAHGISVGLMGARNRDLQRVRAEAAGAGGTPDRSPGV